MNDKTVNDDGIKDKIAQRFGQAVNYYNEHAKLQREIADRLIASLKPWRNIIPNGPIIELGCGTGFVTEGLAELYSGREIKGIDISKEMVNFCRQKFDNKHIDFEVGDAESPPFKEPHYSMVVAGSVAHWFKDPALSLAKWLETIKPGGLLLASFPGNESFPEWRKHCRELGLPFTGNPLPDVEEMVINMSVGPSQIDYYEDTVTQTFESAADFFQQLKMIGASTQIKGRSLTSRELSLLIDHWNASTEGPIRVNNHIVFLAVKRDYES